MLKDLQPGDVFPDFELPDENGALHLLSELQGDAETRQGNLVVIGLKGLDRDAVAKTLLG